MTAPADVAMTGLTGLDVRARTDAGQVNMVWPSTRSWISIARRSDGQTPRNAYRGGSSSSSVTSKPAAVRAADHSRSRGGCRNRFQLCGPAAWPKAASSSRRRSR